MKKILICSTTGGGGHLIVTEALMHYLGSDYTVEVVSIFNGILSSLDLVKIISLGNYNWIRLYDDLLVGKWFRILNWCKTLGAWYLQLRHKSLVRIITAYLKEQQPDMVISVVPLINDALIEATRTLNIPLCILPTDLDASMFINGIKKPDHPNLVLAYSFDEPAIYKTIKPAEFAPTQLSAIGFPMRPDFLTPKNNDQIKKKYGIPLDKPVILLLMGYQGSQALYAFAQELTTLTIPVHLVICTGKDEKIAHKIHTIAFPPHISITIVGFTGHIAELMSIADLLIAKSGSVSLCEALYMNLPIFLDATTSVLQWERFNHKFVTKHHFGESIRRLCNITPLVHKFFTDENYRKRIQYNVQQLKKKDAGREIHQLISKKFLVQ